MSILSSLRRYRLIAWITCMAVLFGALAPTVTHTLSQAFASARGGHTVWVQMCSMDGPKMIAVSFDQEPKKSPDGHPVPGSMQPGERCPFCSIHADALVVLHPIGLAFAAVPHAGILPHLFYHAPRPLFAWAPGHPRGPPAVS